MALGKDFNPKGVLVARKSGGLALGGRRYAQGEAISDDCISLRKKQQLYKQNLVCHPHEISAAALPAAPELTEEQKQAQAKKDADAQAVADKEAEDAKAAEAEAEAEKGDDDNSGEEGSSEEPSDPPVVVAEKTSRKKRAKKKTSNKS